MAQNKSIRPAAAAALLWMLSGFWFLDSYNSAPDEFSLYDKIYAVCWVAAVLFAQTIIALAFYFCRVPAAVINLLFSCFAAANIYSLNLILVDGFYGMDGAAQVLIMAAGAGAAYGVFSSLRESRWKTGALAAAFFLFGWSAAKAAAYEWRLYAPNKSVAPALGGMTSATGIKAPVFAVKPNVYFISFDGLLAQPLAEKYFSMGETPYHSALKQRGFRIFKNHFSSSPDTRRSINKFLALDPEYYYALKESQRNGMAAGRTPAPLYEIFKANGYATYFNNFSGYFGPRRGIHVDHYVIPRVFSACTFMRGGRLIYMFFTFCPMLSLINSTEFLKFGGGEFRLRGGYRESDLRRMLLMYYDSYRRGENGVFLSYVFWPGHFIHPYDYLRPETHETNIREFAGRAKLAAYAVNEIMYFIKKLNRPAIVYIFGDHGPWYSNGLMWNDSDEKRRRFIVQDRYGVTGALYPADVCSKYFTEPPLAEYITPPEVARRIIRCLAGGEDPVANPVKYQLDYDERGYQEEEKGDYADYLYE
ncbi:MAG: LTA synthase family protein [Betaproteobacteria bacterium]|nr:LTA synthase family protein [Betaproteobacteria bacterium]